MAITHEEQRDKWNEEHAHPFALVQMDKHEPSHSVLWFIDFLTQRGVVRARSVEMGCGKGRNVIHLAKQSWITLSCGFDFSEVAIFEAQKRALDEAVSNKTEFRILDATSPWEYESGFFDVGIDCAASTDIETKKGRHSAAKEMFRVMKPGGYLMAFGMSEDDAYHQSMRQKSPAEEDNAFYHPQTGKFEKVFTADEFDEQYSLFRLVEARRRKTTVRFFNVPYGANLHWRVYQKPLE
jgi:SAM-dependent methyltransferase